MKTKMTTFEALETVGLIKATFIFWDMTGKLPATLSTKDILSKIDRLESAIQKNEIEGMDFTWK